MRRGLLSAVVAAVLVLPMVAMTPPAAAATMTVADQIAKLQGDVQLYDSNGWRSAINGDGTVVVTGAASEDIQHGSSSYYDQGAAYLYRDTGTEWTTTKLVKPDGLGGEMFGYAVAVDDVGVVAAVSAWREGAGAVYVYRYTDGSWNLEARLTPGDGVVGDEFGSSMAISRDASTILVGAQSHEVTGGAEVYEGAAYVFARPGGTWVQQAELQPTSGAWDQLGMSVALDADGNTALLGSAGWNEGEAFLFRKTDTTWNEAQRLQSDDLTDGWLSEGDNEVALDATGSVAVVGDWDGKQEVHVFRDTGTTWAGYARDVLTSPSPADGSWFGYAVALDADGSTLVAGDWHASAYHGEAFVYTYDGSDWTFETTLVPDERAVYGGYGDWVGVSGDATRLGVAADGMSTFYVFALVTADVSVPGAPQNADAQLVGGTGATVTWEAPTSDGGAQIQRYQVTASPAVTPQYAYPGETLSASFSDLTPGTSYTFSVEAENVAGTGPAATAPLVTAAVPGAVQNVTAVAGDSKARVNWEAPSDPGDLPVTHYQVSVSPSVTGLPVLVAAPATSWPITGLTNGTAYTFTVAAVSNVGTGPGTSAAAVTPQALTVTISNVTVVKFTVQTTFTYSGVGVTGASCSVRDVRRAVVEISATSCTSPWTATVAGGTKQVTVSVTDAYGDTASDSMTFKVKGKPLPHH